MADIPKYERNTGIQSATAVTGFADALKEVGRNAYSGLGQMGQQLAQSAANEQARQDGIEAAKNPGRQLLPVFTQADNEFVNSYKREVGQSLSFEGTRSINELYNTAEKSPNESTLAAFEKEGRLSIDEKVALAPKDMQGDLKRHLESAYYASFQKLTHKISQFNNQYLNSQNNKFDAQQVEDIRDAGLSDDQELSKERFEERNKTIHQRELEYLETGGERGYSPEMGAEQKKANYDNYLTSNYVGKLKSTPEGERDQFIKDLRKSPPDNLTPSQQDNVVKAALSYNHEYNAALRGQQAIDYARYENAITSGTMTPDMALEAERNLSALQYEGFKGGVLKTAQRQAQKLAQMQAKQQAKQEEQTAEFNHVLENSDRPDVLSSVPTKKFDEFSSRLVGQAEKAAGFEKDTMPLKDQIGLLKQFERPNPYLSAKISNSILSGSPESSISAMKAYNLPGNRDALALRGVNDDASATATAFDRFSKAGNSDNDSYIKAKEQMNVTPEVKERRKEQFNEILKKDFKDDSDRKSYTAKGLDISKGQVPSSLPILYKRELQDNYLRTGNIEDAKRETKKSFDQNWGITHINGFEQYEYMPMEKYFPNIEHVDKYIRAQMIDGFEKVVADTKALFDANPMQDFYYEMNVKKTGNDNKFEEQYKGKFFNLLEGGEIKIKQIFRNGDVKEGRLVTQADDRSAIPVGGYMPNYLVGIDNGTVFNPIYSPKDSQPMRYQPNYEDIMERFERHMESEREMEGLRLLDKKTRAVETFKALKILGPEPGSHAIGGQVPGISGAYE